MSQSSPITLAAGQVTESDRLSVIVNADDREMALILWPKRPTRVSAGKLFGDRCDRVPHSQQCGHRSRCAAQVPAMTMNDIKYPDIRIKLTGTDDNAYAVLGHVRRALRPAVQPERADRAESLHRPTCAAVCCPSCWACKGSKLNPPNRRRQCAARLHESAARAGWGAVNHVAPLSVARIAASLGSALSRKASTCSTS